jgi:branched-chain amino acid transport system permease protein
MPMRPLVTRYEQDQAIFPGPWHKLGLAIGILLVVSFPWWAGPRWLTVGNLSLIAIVGSVALMILTGFAGQISLGHAAFLGLGAYTMAIVGLRAELPFWIILPLSGLVAAAVGLAAGIFALRLKGLYLAIVTIGILYLVQHALHALPKLTGGMSGLRVPIRVWFGSGETRLDPGTLYFVFLILAAAIALAAKNLMRSNRGRAMMAVRDRDLAAASLGVDPARTKVAAFALSSFIAGVAGGMFALQQQYLTIEPFHLLMSVEYIAMIVLGGIGSVFGAVAGAIAVTALSPLAGLLGAQLPYLSRLSSAQQSTVLFSVLVCVVLVFEPLGLSGVWMRIKRYFAAWPFRY